MDASLPSTLAAVPASDLKTGIIVLLAVVFVLFRLMQRHQVSRGLLVLVPVLLLIFGIEDLHAVHEAGAVALLAACIVVEFGIGLMIGRTFTMWREADGAPWAQGTKWTIVLWVVAIVVRSVFIGLAQALDLDVTESAEILITLAASFAGQNIMLAKRADMFRLERAEPPAGAERL